MTKNNNVDFNEDDFMQQVEAMMNAIMNGDVVEFKRLRASTGEQLTGKKLTKSNCHGWQLWEPCPVCGDEPVGGCGYCKKHCVCPNEDTQSFRAKPERDTRNVPVTQVRTNTAIYQIDNIPKLRNSVQHLICPKELLHTHELLVEIIHALDFVRCHYDEMKPLSLIMTVEGYGNDKRELWQIPRVQRFAWRLFEEISWFPMMLEEEHSRNCSCWMKILYSQIHEIVCINPKNPFSRKWLIDAITWNHLASLVDVSKVPQELIKDITLPLTR